MNLEEIAPELALAQDALRAVRDDVTIERCQPMRRAKAAALHMKAIRQLLPDHFPTELVSALEAMGQTCPSDFEGQERVFEDLYLALQAAMDVAYEHANHNAANAQLAKEKGAT